MNDEKKLTPTDEFYAVCLMDDFTDDSELRFNLQQALLCLENLALRSNQDAMLRLVLAKDDDAHHVEEARILLSFRKSELRNVKKLLLKLGEADWDVLTNPF